MKWFRFYSEFRSDPKMRRMPIIHRYAFIVLLCLASDGDRRGEIRGLDDDDIAYELEMSLEDWQTLKAKFRVKGLIEIADKNCIVVCNWDKRQFESDSSAARVARHRDKKRKQPCNVTETLVKRHVTPPDTDTDSEADSEADSNTNSEQERKKKSPSFSELEPESIATIEVEVLEEITESSLTTFVPVQKTTGNEAREVGETKVPPRRAQNQIDFERFRETYNQHKPIPFAAISAINPKRQKVFQELVRDCGGEAQAIAALENALRYASADVWYGTKSLTFENFASNGKIIQLHEKFLSCPARMPSDAEVKSMQTRMMIRNAIAPNYEVPHDRAS